MLHHERRKHRRYLVEGKVLARTGSRRFAGGLVDLSEGGALLVTAEALVPVGTHIAVAFAIAGYQVNVQGRVARAATHVVGIAFSNPPLELEQAVLWLEAGFFSSMF